MIRNLLILLVIAIISISLTDTGKQTDGTAFDEEVTAVENHALNQTQSIYGHLQTSVRGQKPRTLGGNTQWLPNNKQLIQKQNIQISSLEKVPMISGYHVPHYIYWRNLRI